jgi:methionyl-tRNA formyltransferase
MSNTKILLLCNNSIAIPALKELLFYQQVAAVVIPAANKPLQAEINELAAPSSVPVIIVNRQNFTQQVKKSIEKYNVMAVVMMTFPYIIPATLLKLPPKGFINFHYGRLPEYRGPEPIFAQVRAQEKKPGLAVHVVGEGIDDGPVILQETFAYDPDDTYGILKNKLGLLGAKLITLLMKILSFGKLVPAVAQDESNAQYHKKPAAEDLIINWQSMDAETIKALVNACNPWNKGCGAKIKGSIIGITEVEILENETGKEKEPGTVTFINDTRTLYVSLVKGKLLKVNIIYTEHGFTTGFGLHKLGINTDDIFTS